MRTDIWYVPAYLSRSSGIDNFQGYTLLSSYDTASCAAQCTNILGCQAINIAFERAPSVDPGTGCEDPASTTLIKCVFCMLYYARVVKNPTNLI